MTGKKLIMPDFVNRRTRYHYLTALNLLSTMGISLSEINIRAMGIYENYRGEIRAQQPPPGTSLAPGTRITLEIGYHSAVDYMPYQFFYGMGPIRKTGKTWEMNARSLLAPFDASVIRYDARMRFQALKYEFGVIDTRHWERFMKQFEFDPRDSGFGIDDTILWISVLPSLYRWGGNREVVAAVLGRLLKYKFRLRENVRASTAIPKELRYRLGLKTARLGKETVLGRSFKENDSTYELEISDIPGDEVAALLPGGKMRRRIERLLDYSMPDHLDRRITLKVNRSGLKGDRQRYLGYSTYI